MKLLKSALVALCLLPAAASAATLKGEIFVGSSNEADFDTLLSSANLLYTFDVTTVGSISGGGPTLWNPDILQNQLNATNIVSTNTGGADWPSPVGALIATTMRLTGFIDASQLNGVLSGTANDALRLSVGGQKVLAIQTISGTTAGAATYSGPGGVQSFELIYSNGPSNGDMQVFQTINAVTQPLVLTAQPDPATVPSGGNNGTIGAIPLPAGLPLIVTAFAGLFAIRRRKSAA